MADNTAKSFKVPKIRKDNKDGLREIDVNGRDAQDIKNIVQRSYIENGYKPQWHLKAVQYVRNRELEERYRLKRAEMKDEGRNARDLGEQYTYLLFRDTAMVPGICKEGLKCRSLPFNALGNSKLGLYLSRNADIQLRLAENWQMNICVMVIFKITPGKCKVLISGSDGGEDMEPTPNYDCHVSQYQPRSCDPIHLQLARSQIYLYEYTEDCEPSDCPRHCLPYAVLTYQRSENKSQSSQAQSDSYSKRPTVADRSRPEKGSSDSCSDLLNKVVDTLNVTDPRLSKNDPRRDAHLNPQDPRTGLVTGQGAETGLCVPRLTAGPETGLCVPRLTAGPPPGTASSAPTPTTVSSRDPRAQSGSAYRPSFGPEFESDNNELLQSLIQNQLEQQQQLAFQTNQNPPAMHPNDPRLRRNDPRTRSDPRLDPRKDPRVESRVDPRLDPRLNQRSDPRLETRSDPRLDLSLDPSTDPRLDPIISNPRIRRTGSQSVSNTSVSKSKSIYSDNPSLRKKMSISDYKQKVGIQPAVKAVDSQESQGDDEEYDPTAVSDYQQTVRAARIDQQKDARTSQDGLVDNSDDMKKALDELSDPEGSPSHKASPPHDESPSHMAMLEEVAAEDPGLAEAMRKLVEHAGDMSLFTEALSKLQESAEELGDALHDPAFLVKAIAENVESLKKAKSLEIDTNDDDNANDNSDVLSKASRSETEVPTTKRSQHQLMENKPEVASEESAMEQAMKNTLEEFHKTEQVVTQSSSSFTGQVFSYAQNEPNRDPKVLDLVDVSSIPIPDYSPKKPRKVDNSIQSPFDTDLQSIPLPENSPMKKRNTDVSDNQTNKDVSDNDINNDFTINQTNKSISTLSVDKTDEKTSKVFDNEREKNDIVEIKDKDERLTSNSAIDISKVSHSDSDEDHRSIQTDVTSFKPYLEIVDQDYRLQERNKYLGFVIDTESKAKMSYDISHSGLEMMKHSESLNSLADKDERMTVDADEIKDRDERVSTSSSVNNVIDVQDKDERHVVEDKALSLETTNVIMDKDERILPSKSQTDLSSMTFEDPSFLDKDERRSHSRSQSPPNRTTVIDISDSSSSVHINRLGSEIDLDRIRSRSASPSSVTGDTEDVKIIPLHNLDDSQSSADSVMFDAYNLGGKDTAGQNNEGVENEFGDVDWRLAAEAAEMGDIDLRASKSATSKSSSSSVSLSQENVPSTHTEASRVDVSASQSSLSQDSADIDLRGSATSLSESNTEVGGSNIDLREIKGSNIDLRASSTDLSDSDKDLEIKSSNIDLRASSSSLGDSKIAISEPLSERQFDSPDPRSMREPNISAMSSPNQNLSVHNPQIMLPPTNFQSFHYTSNMQPMFGQPMNIMQPAGGFVMNPPRLVPFVTYRAPIPSFNAPMNFGGEYRSGRFQERAYRDPYSYSTGGSGIEQYPNRNMNQAGPPLRHPNQVGPPGPPGPGGMHNLMNRVDFSNLKNILAAVHVPGPGMAPGDPRGAPGPFPGAGPQTGSDVGNINPDSDEERENQPAFCTGLSFLKTKSPNKKEKKRTKYTGLAKGTEAGLDEQLDQSESTPTLPGLGSASRQDDALPELIPGLSSGGIPGLEASPESPTSAGNADKPFTFSQDIPDRDISSEWYEGSPTKDTKKSDKSESKSKSPKKKSKRKRNESRNSDNDDCWQDAFFDIRGESPTLDEQNDGNKDDVTVPQINELSTDNTGVVVENDAVNLNQDGKRALDFTDEEASIKKMKTEVTTTTTLEYGDDDDSDDENGLVIDLDSSSVKPSESGETVITIEDDTSNDKIDMPGRSATPVQDEPTSGQATPVLDEGTEGRHTPVQDENNEGCQKAALFGKGSKDKDTKGRSTPVQDENDEDKEAESGDNDGVEILEDEPVGTPTNKSEMKKFIEKKRKNIVIKLKGETKIVDVKTGKAYNDNIVGSAIEVLGQPKKAPQNVQQPLPHPIVQKPVKKEFKGASISTLIDRKAIPNYSNRYSRDQEPMKEYTHPYTGQKMVYPIQPVSSAQAATPQTVLSIPTIGSQNNNQPARGQASNQTKLAISDNSRKRNTTDKPDIVSDPKRVKVEQNNTVIKVLTDPSQSEPSVSDSKQESKSDPSQGEPSTADNTQDTNKTEGDGESELEDGEISDDDDDDNADDKPVKKERKKHSRKSGERRHKRKHREKSRYKHDDYDEYNDYDDYDDYDEYGYSKHDDYEYSRRREYDYDSDYGRDSDVRLHKAGSDWSELLQSTKKEQIERIPNRAGSSTEFSEEENKLLSNSAAKFIKAKQRMLAKTQMKTLGDWLKVELEIDNIEPLQNILQYSLDTDLSVIPKPKRRKIRMKVKSVIEEEGKKQSAVGTNRYDSYAGEEMFDSPEVSHEQIERELGMVKDVRQTLYRPMDFRRKNPLMLHHKPLMPGSYEEIALQGALGTVEMCMDALLGRTNYFGYPNRRVPQDLLFDEETSSLKSVCGTLFLILVSPISLKSQKKLSLLKDVYKKLCKQKESASVPKNIDTEIESLLVQRQNMLRPFTGYLNKKRINKLQEQSDAFKMVYDFYKTQVPPFPDSAIMYIKITWQDLQQHLILAKQYLTAEEKKV